MRIHNGTPHAIRIVDKDSATYNAEIRKWVSAEPIFLEDIPSSGMLSAVIITDDMDGVAGLPVRRKLVASCDPVPDADVIIVSVMYASAARQFGYSIENLYTVADPVYTEDGSKVLGSLGICPAL